MADVNQKELPSETFKPSIKNSFFIKEQRWANPVDFVEPDDETIKHRNTGSHLIDYIQGYRQKPKYVEQRDRTTQALKKLRAT